MRRVPHVVGVCLEGEAEDAECLAAEIAAKRLADLSTMSCLWRSLARSTVSTISIGVPKSLAVLTSARKSFGKHEPPKPGPAAKKSVRCDVEPDADGELRIFAPVASQSLASSLMKVTLVARIALAAI